MKIRQIFNLIDKENQNVQILCQILAKKTCNAIGRDGRSSNSEILGLPAPKSWYSGNHFSTPLFDTFQVFCENKFHFEGVGAGLVLALCFTLVFLL